MSQNPLIDSGTQASKTPGLKPALAAALASLEVQLDQELARYRRTRTGTRIPNQPRMGNYISSPSQQSVSVSTTLDQPQQSVTEIKVNTPPASAPDTPQREPVAATAKTEDLDNFDLPSIPEVPKTQTPPPPPPPRINSGSSIVRAGVQANKSENLLHPDETPKAPDDYLESSEALLRSLTDEQSQTKKPSNSNDGLLSPLGIGSMLLLLVASLTLGFIVFNPKSLTQINISKLFNSNSSPSKENTAKVESIPQPKPEVELTPIPKYPNLAAKEFPEVKDPIDVVGLKPKDQTTPTPLPSLAPAPTVTPVETPPIQLPSQQPANPTGELPVPINSPIASTDQTAQNSPPADQTLPNPEIKPSADGFYHVVTDNQGDRAYTLVREIIPDAYLSLDNKLIFLGAFKTQQEVQKHIQLLEAKGIKARIQQP
ncbi:MAG: hypothetical protein KME32_01025 [Mojavia pulchra JT2-VF2]|jgi:hypothetical protein|uniref:SPOR domain-containing protein n=1 Tax=Mojavia pulchra JT2-VF2 TaxID=287848 RepID=A0A951PTT7_9NOST|nr:hypothetical protein [Mojavia pulchra JT2-VF2]